VRRHSENGPAGRARRIALSFPLRLGPWPEIVRGVYQYAGAHAHWAVSLHTKEDIGVALARKPDGVIAMVRSADAAAKLTAWGGPVVDTAYDVEGTGFAQVGFDTWAIGQLAAEHLL
jgi:DNA-binding LacI/PurR family transcriptional regulator